MACAQCGTETAAGQKFCAECGARLLVACASCGTGNPPHHRYCSECGTALSEPADRDDIPRGEHPGAAGTEVSATQERRVVTVLFADLVGFTTYAESRDPEEVRGFLTRYFDAAKDTIERFGGVVEKFIGDAVMGAWGVAVAQEDDAERAVRAALELVEEVAKFGADEGLFDLALRAGVLTGEAAVGSGLDGQAHVVGDIVNTASRLQAVAEPGTVLVGEPTFRAANRAIAFEPVGSPTLKGKELDTPAWRALHVRGLRGGGRRTEALEPPFVGREEELRLLKDQLHATGRERRCRLVSITGIAGIGKSRLVWELLKYVDGLVEPVYWHDGRSPAYGEGIAFWALAEMVRGRARIAETDDPTTSMTKLREMLERHVTGADDRSWLELRLAGLLGLRDMPAGERGELFSAFRRLFEHIASGGTTVLVFEDLHWADAALLDFVEELPEWSRDHPILIVTLARPELLDRRPSWGAGRRNVVSAHLGPLPADAVHELIVGLVPGIPGDAVESVVERAAGIPLYAVELVRTLLFDGRIVADDDGTHRLVGNLATLAIPESLHAAIAARLDRLDPDDRALVQDAAVLGQTFTPVALAALTGISGDDLAPRLSELVRRELLTLDVDPRSPERGQYGFVQSLIREVAYSRLARAERRGRHIAVAQHFEAADDPELAGIVADHYLNALNAVPDQADTELRDRTLAALDDAAARAATLHSHEQVLAYCEHAFELVAGTDDEPVWWERAARSAHALARHEVAEEHARRVVEWHAERGDRHGLARAQHLVALILAEGYSPDRALEWLEPIAAGLDGIDDDPDGTALVALLARAHMLNGDVEAAAAVADRVLVAAERQDLLEVIADALITRGTAIGDLGRPRQGTALLRAALDLARTEDLAHAQLRASGNLAYVSDDLRANRVILTEGLEHARRLGERRWVYFFARNLIGALYHLGQWDDAVALLDELEDTDLPEHQHVLFEAQRMVIVAQRGDVGRARSFLQSKRSEWEAESDPQARRGWRQQMALVEMLAGDDDAAWRLALEGVRSDPFGHVSNLGVAATVALTSGRPDRLRTIRDAIDELPRQDRIMRGVRSALSAALAVLDGDPDTATPELESLRSHLVGFRVSTATLLYAFGRLAEGRHPAAADVVREAGETLADIGARAYLELWSAQAAPDADEA